LAKQEGAKVRQRRLERRNAAMPVPKATTFGLGGMTTGSAFDCAGSKTDGKRLCQIGRDHEYDLALIV
jgi:hypothetical protein